MKTKILFLMLFAFSAAKMQGQCVANFYIYEDTLNAPHTYIGVNTSIANVMSTYTWYWGDGNVDTGFNPISHTYAAAGNYNICLVLMGGGCIDSFCSNENINKVAADMLSVTFGAAPASVQEVSKAPINKIYPNPTSDLLFIQDAKLGKYQYEIYSMSGSKVLSGNVSANEGIKVSSLPISLYLIKLKDSNGKIQYSKFTKQ